MYTYYYAIIMTLSAAGKQRLATAGGKMAAQRSAEAAAGQLPTPLPSSDG